MLESFPHSSWLLRSVSGQIGKLQFGVYPKDLDLFISMVNDLNVSDDTVKFVDDTTLWEIIMRDQQPASALPLGISNCSSWVTENNMRLNPAKSKEI